MTVTARLNLSVSNFAPTNNGSCAPQMNSIVNCALAILNTGGSDLSIRNISNQNPRPSYGPIADELYGSLIDQVIPASSMVMLQWQQGYTNAGPVNAYGTDIVLQMSDGTNVTPAPAPGDTNLALSSVIATNLVWIAGVKFTATAHSTGNVGGVGAPLFDVGSDDTGTAVNLAAAINQIFGANTATPSTTNVIMIPPAIYAGLATGTVTVTSSSTISVGASYAVGDQITISGRQTAGAGGNLATYTFIASNDNTQTSGSGAPYFYAGANATAYGANLAAAIVALFGTATATASSGVVTFGATLAANDLGIGNGAQFSAPALTVAAGTNIATPLPILFTITPGTEVALP